MVENETRGFDVNARLTVPMRDKEVKQDYRFMPGMLTDAIFCNLLYVLFINFLMLICLSQNWLERWPTRKMEVLHELFTRIPYFLTEPNLPPLRLRDSGSRDDSNANPNILNVDDYRQEMAPLPAQTRSILVNQHQLGLAKAARLLEDPDSLKVFLEVMQIDPSYPGICADYILSELEFFRKKFHLETVIGMALTPSHLAGVDTN